MAAHFRNEMASALRASLVGRTGLLLGLYGLVLSGELLSRFL